MKKIFKVGVYAAVKNKNEVLLIKKARGPYKKHWDLPGGRIEFGEEPEEALARELEEETGLVLKSAKLNCVLSELSQIKSKNGISEQTHRVGIIYNCTCSKPGNIKTTPDGNDSLGAKWILQREIKNIKLTPFAEMILHQRG